MKALKKNDIVHIVFSDGKTFYTNKNVKEPFGSIDELWKFVKDNMNKEDGEKTIKQALLGDMPYTREDLIERVRNSRILDIRGNIVYMPDVSTISMPEDFVLKIIKAEEAGDKQEVNKYRNFWSFVSLNPDARVRDNLFWFIRKWDMQISPAGFIVAYRNVLLRNKAGFTLKQARQMLADIYRLKHRTSYHIDLMTRICNGENYSPYGDLYTDNYSGNFMIKLGEPVRMDRNLCDPDQETSCSSGLHCGAKGWLKKNYCGDVGIMVLVNPANVVAVPTIDEYGKMRCCEYFPVCTVDFDENGNVIEPAYYDDVEYLDKTLNNCVVNNEDVNLYELSPHYYLYCNHSREEIYDDILQKLKNGN